MKIRFLVIASMIAAPVCAVRDRNTSDRCKPMDVMMGVHKAEPVKPEGSLKAPLLPKAHIDSKGPAVLIPNCREEESKRRKKDDYPLA